ncbi:MAG: hypothetical protein WC044_04835 [Crocinitomicaceae bacterium]
MQALVGTLMKPKRVVAIACMRRIADKVTNDNFIGFGFPKREFFLFASLFFFTAKKKKKREC